MPTYADISILNCNWNISVYWGVDTRHWAR